MDAAFAVDLMRQALLCGLLVALPVLVAVLLVGVVVGILQAATGLQEFTLTFVPKVLTVLALVLLLGGLGLRLLTEFTVRVLQLVPHLGGR